MPVHGILLPLSQRSKMTKLHMSFYSNSVISMYRGYQIARSFYGRRLKIVLQPC